MDTKKHTTFNIISEIDESKLKALATISYLPRRLLKSGEVIEFFQIHRNTLSNWKREGMPFVKMNNRRGGAGARFDAEQIVRWLELRTKYAD
jgi:hypothetical protein